MGLCICAHFMDDEVELARKANLSRGFTVMKSRILAKKLPIIWINNEDLNNKNHVANHSHACNIAERFGYACISLDAALKEEAGKNTKKGKKFKNKLRQKKKIPDRVILNLLKERMIKAGETRGYLIDGFPLNNKQSQLFVKEIGNVDCIIVLESGDKSENKENKDKKDKNVNDKDSGLSVGSSSTNASCSSKTPSVKSNLKNLKSDSDQFTIDKPAGDRKNLDLIKNEKLYKELYSTMNLKYDLVVEKINTNEPPADVFLKIEAAILDRLSVNKT